MRVLASCYFFISSIMLNSYCFSFWRFSHCTLVISISVISSPFIFRSFSITAFSSLALISFSYCTSLRVIKCPLIWASSVLYYFYLLFNNSSAIFFYYPDFSILNYCSSSCYWTAIFSSYKFSIIERSYCSFLLASSNSSIN